MTQKPILHFPTNQPKAQSPMSETATNPGERPPTYQTAGQAEAGSAGPAVWRRYFYSHRRGEDAMESSVDKSLAT